MKSESAIDERLAPMVREVFAEMIQQAPSGPIDATREALIPCDPSPNANTGSRRVLTMVAATITAVIGLLGIAIVRDAEQAPSHGESASMLDQAASDALSPWRDGIRMIVYLSPGAPHPSTEAVRHLIDQSVDTEAPTGIRYLGPQESLKQARRLLAEDPVALEQLDVTSIPTAFYVTPQGSVTHAELAAAASTIQVLPDVLRVDIDPRGQDLIPGVHAG
jgi:hypothetical protein